jgi:hypothetical protein
VVRSRWTRGEPGKPATPGMSLTPAPRDGSAAVRAVQIETASGSSRLTGRRGEHAVSRQVPLAPRGVTVSGLTGTPTRRRRLRTLPRPESNRPRPLTVREMWSALAPHHDAGRGRAATPVRGNNARGRRRRSRRTARSEVHPVATSRVLCAAGWLLCALSGHWSKSVSWRVDTVNTSAAPADQLGTPIAVGLFRKASASGLSMR